MDVARGGDVDTAGAPVRRAQELSESPASVGGSDDDAATPSLERSVDQSSHEAFNQEAVETAIASPEIQKGLQDRGTPAELLERATERLNELWKTAPSSWGRYVQARASTADAQVTARARIVAKASEDYERSISDLIGSAFSALVVIVGGGAIAYFGRDFDPPWRWLAISFALVVGFTGAMLAARGVRRMHTSRTIARTLTPETVRRLDVVADPGVERSLLELSALRTAAVEDRIKQVIGVLRLTLDEWLPTASDTILSRHLDDSGLHSLAPDDLVLEGTAVDEVTRLVDKLPTAAIGIAGPRGAGKSTLIDWLCQSTQVGSTPVLTIKVDAPVDYDSRDFLLHLFATVCIKLGAQRAEPDRSDPPTRSSEFGLGSVDQRVGLGLSLIGAMIVFAAASARIRDNQVDIADAASFIGVSVGLLGGWLWGFSTLRSRRAHAERDRQQAMQEDLEQVRAGALLVPEAQNALDDIVFQQTHTWGWSGKVSLSNPLLPLGAELGAKGDRQRSTNPKPLPDLVKDLRQLLELAARGDPEAPTASPTFARKFVVCIDEVDKISSTEDASQFVNDVKAVFGTRGCFFVVSVSEDALRSFERRGLPLRDAFDSAFDEIVEVPFGTYDDTRRLISTRVINPPEPFVALCHVLGGGLPRDSIRAARDIFRYRDIPIDKVASTIASRNVERRARATAGMASRYCGEPDSAALLVWTDELCRDLTKATSPAAQMDVLSRASVAGRELLGTTSAVQTLSPAATEIRQLVNEMAVFASWSLSVIEYFSRQGVGEVVASQVGDELSPKGFQQLARVRQAFSLHTELVSERLRAYRAD